MPDVVEIENLSWGEADWRHFVQDVVVSVTKIVKKPYVAGKKQGWWIIPVKTTDDLLVFEVVPRLQRNHGSSSWFWKVKCYLFGMRIWKGFHCEFLGGLVFQGAVTTVPLYLLVSCD